MVPVSDVEEGAPVLAIEVTSEMALAQAMRDEGCPAYLCSLGIRLVQQSKDGYNIERGGIWWSICIDFARNVRENGPCLIGPLHFKNNQAAVFPDVDREETGGWLSRFLHTLIRSGLDLALRGATFLCP